ncbi:DMT family transporter [Variovorax sp.]|uniref:DMT family transporter n=1 Tax=Variovorax sp. TaxID=1871043 RepID=UPI002D2ECE92|nr:DMT family transporter [Variovorax sp.]HYP85124.1 DMT family transporter [Variovorax sp.]
MLPPGTLRGIAAMLAACAAFACMDALLKVLSGSFAPAQVAALRGLTALPLVCLYVAWRRETGALFARGLRWRLHLLRALLTITMLMLFTFGLKTLGLAEAYTLTFVAPLVITLLSVPLLGERVRARHWVAIAVGFAGVVVALRPDGGAFVSAGALAILAAAVCYALSNVLGRLVSRTEPSATLVFWTTMGLALGGSALAAPQWVPVRAEHGWLLAGLAVSGFLGQLAISEAFRHGQAAAIAPFEYSALAWGIALDWLIWHAVPDAWTLGGGVIIIASGLYLARSEAPRALPAPRPAA